MSLTERKNFLNLVHLELGHGSINNTKFFLRYRSEWEEVKDHIKEFVDECSICAAGG